MKKIAMLLAVAMLLCSLASGFAEGEGASFTGTAQGFGGDVTVEITVDETGKITGASITGNDETPEVGGAALEPLAEQLIAAGNAEIDGVAGASFTSAAVKAAAADALALSRGEEVVHEDVPLAGMTPGEYTDTQKGYLGIVTVNVKVAEDAIESVEISETTETPQIIATVVDRLPERIVAAQSTAVDSITGATASSNAVKTAVRNCLIEAGADESMIANSVLKTDEVLDYEADIVVVGGGTSGSAAAAQATQNGAKVVIVEKSGRIGGSGAISSGILGIGSTMQKEQNLTYSTDTVFKEWMEGNHWMVPNAKLLRKYLNMTGETVDWLVDNGFVFAYVSSFDGTDETDVHWYEEPAGNGAFGVAGQQYFNSLTKDVDTILLETTVTDFLFNDDGTIAGVTGIRYDGATVNVKAKAVILATGGFAGSAELQQELYGTNYRFFGLLQNQGTAIKLGQEVGAVVLHATTACAHFFAPIRDVTGIPAEDANLIYDVVVTPSLLNVNDKGVRFGNEANAEAGWLESAQYRFQQGGSYYVILSQSQVDTLINEGTAGLGLTAAAINIPFLGHATEPDQPLTNLQTALDAAVEQGIAYRGDTAEALAEATGMNAEIFAQNLADYEAACEAGEDMWFGKAANYLVPLGEGPYYAIAATAVPYNTMGGLEINENTEVVDADYNAIPGLYAVGMDSMGTIIDGVGYPDFGGPATSWSLNSGRLAGMNASAYAAGK